MMAASRRAVLAGAATLLASRADAAAYPERPVRIIVPFAPGGPSDLCARLMAGKLAEALGAPFIVENRPGAGSNIGTAFVAHAEPDGYTLLITSSAFVVNPGLYKRIPYDPVADFAPIAELVTSPNAFIANPASGIGSMAELVARARAQPGAIAYASAGIGTTPHLAGEMLQIAAGIKLTHVPYNGGGPAVQAVLAGTVPIACAALPGAHALIQSGALRALAVTGATRWWDMPDVPTMIEQGYPGFLSDTFHGALAPARTPSVIVDRVASALIAAMAAPAFHEQLRSLGFEPIGHGPDGLRERIETEVAKYRALISSAGIERV